MAFALGAATPTTLSPQLPRTTTAHRARSWWLSVVEPGENLENASPFASRRGRLKSVTVLVAIASRKGIPTRAVASALLLQKGIVAFLVRRRCPGRLKILAVLEALRVTLTASTIIAATLSRVVGGIWGRSQVLLQCVRSHLNVAVYHQAPRDEVLCVETPDYSAAERQRRHPCIALALVAVALPINGVEAWLPPHHRVTAEADKRQYEKRDIPSTAVTGRAATHWTICSARACLTAMVVRARERDSQDEGP